MAHEEVVMWVSCHSDRPSKNSIADIQNVHSLQVAAVEKNLSKAFTPGGRGGAVHFDVSP